MTTSDFPFTFSWVNETDNTFDPVAFDRFDENILSFKITHSEGQIPTLDLTIKNPRIGLLSSTRKVWGWFAWQSPADDPDYAGALVPLFFGVLIGVPNNLFKETISIQLNARASTFIADKQAVAESMKVFPYYDPFWFDTSHRDDPDAILEGWSSLWHVDRTSLTITASDVLVGEDGTITFGEDVALYDSVSCTLGQPPLTNIRVEATCNWKQRTSGFFDVPPVNVMTYTGDSFLGDWPRPGSGIGGGYTVESSYVNDTYHVSQTPNTTYNSSFTNTDPDPGQCSTASSEQSSSGPALLSPNPLSCVLTGEFQSGLCFPDSDPPKNIPAKTSVTGMIVPLWALSASMSLRYDASRSYSEVLAFDMTANTQALLTSPQVAQNTELMTISSVDLGEPLINVFAWTDFRNRSVPIATFIFPNNPTTPGGLSYQVAVQAGVAGNVEPVFSDFAGVTVNDGSVIWASIGEQGVSEAPRWSGATGVPVGQIMLLQDETFNTASGKYEPTPGATSYYLCLTSGVTNAVYRDFTYIPTLVTNDEAPPAAVHVTVIDPPTFSQTPGQQITDGTVKWLVLGLNPAGLQIPIGGTPTDVRANNYFPTARGQMSVEFLISKARARLRFRSRAVTIGWSAAFREGVALSCRKNGTIFDPRLPGGAATGKITEYTLGGSEGKFLTTVQIGAAIGYGNSIAEITGTPAYANAGYMQPGYQRYVGQTVLSGSNDVTYTKPVYQQFDDGLTFPLTWDMVSDGGALSGDLATQKAAIIASFKPTEILAFVQRWAGVPLPQGAGTTTVGGLSSADAWALEREELAFTTQLTPYVMAANGISWSATMKPCVSGPFEGVYSISVSPLVIPQGINLEAGSEP